jgi:hypothetical protein
VRPNRDNNYKRSLLVAAMVLMATTAQAEKRQPHYITPTGPTKVIQYGTVGCLTFEDMLNVVSNKIPGMGIEGVIDGLIEARRCIAVPVGTMVEVMKRPDSKDHPSEPFASGQRA